MTRDHEHPMTRRCRIAVQRAERAVAKLRAKHAEVLEQLRQAENDLVQAQYDLSLNEQIDERKSC